MYAFDHPDEAIDIVLFHMREFNIPANRIHQLRMLDTIKKLMIINESSGIGLLSPSVYYYVGHEFLENNIITSIPQFTEFYHEMVY